MISNSNSKLVNEHKYAPVVKSYVNFFLQSIDRVIILSCGWETTSAPAQGHAYDPLAITFVLQPARLICTLSH